MLTLNTKIQRLPSVGPKLATILNRLGIFYIEDLFYHLPFRYIDFSAKINIGEAKVSQMATLEGKIVSVSARKSFRSKLAFTEAILQDYTGQVRLIWFNQPYLAKQLASEPNIIVAGKIEYYRTLQLTNPYFEVLESKTDAIGKILPVYHLTAGISNLRLVKLVKTAWELSHKNFSDILPNKILKKFKLHDQATSLENLHFPNSQEQIKQAQLSVAVSDILPQQVAVQIKQHELEQSTAPKIHSDVEFLKQQVAKLPFTLTTSQKRAVWDIAQDLTTGKPMNRLLEGDVGSGKTAVALLSSLLTANSGYQTIILAPTEILAKQHLETFVSSPDALNNIALLTRSFQQLGKLNSTKQQLLKQIHNNEIKIVIGTHALLSEKLKIPKLGLVIIDEQHRFGVAQRAFLTKTNNSNAIPHLLSMSATPIPRTLALTLFGNLQISQLQSLPHKKMQTNTIVCSEAERNTAYQQLIKEVQAGHQAFIITPKVEDSSDGVKSVKQEYERITNLFPQFRVGLVYGGQSSEEKESNMTKFSEGKLDILVATTVIEIGIDVPNASLIIIEGAERFGLAQLHQLRGRVGRAGQVSYCYLFTTDDAHQDTERLKIFSQTTDGFALAEYDLQKRGFGDLFGNDQSGFPFKFPAFITRQALTTANLIAKDLVTHDPALSGYPELKKLAQNYLEIIHPE